jgi:hypothetical protein
MKVFISWSGERSRVIAEFLNEWIPCVLQAVEPWISSKNIERGSLWFSEITNQLQDTEIGIICLTRENVEKPWILFESGALAKGLSSTRVCTLLIDINPTDIENPLAQFNHTLPNQDGIYELIKTLNSYLGNRALQESILEKVLENYWSKFEERFQEIIVETETETDEEIPHRSEESLLIELLRTVRSLDKRVRLIEKNTLNNGDYLNSNSSKKDLSYSEIRKKIETYLLNGYNPSEVEKIMKGQLPKIILRETIDKAELDRLRLNL